MTQPNDTSFHAHINLMGGKQSRKYIKDAIYPTSSLLCHHHQHSNQIPADDKSILKTTDNTAVNII
jgi:hypothetical protein